MAGYYVAPEAIEALAKQYFAKTKESELANQPNFAIKMQQLQVELLRLHFPSLSLGVQGRAIRTAQYLEDAIDSGGVPTRFFDTGRRIPTEVTDGG